MDQQQKNNFARAELWVRKSASEGTRQSEVGGDVCLSVEAEGHNGRSNEAKSRPDCEPASGRNRSGGFAGPKDHSAEADTTLHVANPLLCPAKKRLKTQGEGD